MASFFVVHHLELTGHISQIHQDKGTPGRRDTITQGYQDGGTQGHIVTSTSGHWDTWNSHILKTKKLYF